ncbi:hypothetical protein H0H81_007907 [Sphagnurus paluster]|uniref:Elongator complex protein 2 n=1 Tax=Sphagnurus paluster TaxID=117069 RepID=A0A9P7K7D1_9AGAR|nr:hypothetical protein H0H81_007907 [Sphagnurus paluster]
MSASTAYIAASTNRHPQAAHISKASLAAFGSSNLIALWDISDPADHGVLETLTGHEGLVTCVHFISDSSFTSADDRGVLMLWRKVGSQWTRTGKAQAHIKSISSLCVLDEWLATGSSDACVKIWKIIRNGEDSGTYDLVEEQIISLRGKFPLSLALSYLPRSKGHEDWVKALAFLDPVSDGQPLILASGSQDATIRLWTIEAYFRESAAPQIRQTTDWLSDELLDAFEASLGDVGDAEEGGRQISLKRHILTVKSDQRSSQQYSITFDALLVGHEAGITSLAWKPHSPDSTPTLFSTSTDSSVILWSPSTVVVPTLEGSTSIWINRQRFGDIGGQRLGGFVGGAWGQDGKEALAWGWAGGWRRWVCTMSSKLVYEEIWSEARAISGHNGPVKGLDWSASGKYLLSAGLDQTTRVHGEIPSNDPEKPTWHELGRPQVHGYDLLDVAFIDPLRFVSIADEKVARIFEAPGNFVDLAEELGVDKFSDSEHNRPLGAAVPPLGLSNKATDDAQPQDIVRERENRRPFEGELAATTLWPEIEKVFGHGYESMTLAVSPGKQFMATACKATTPEHAVVRVYDTKKYQLVGQPLEGHSLTVTRIAFSPNDNFVLSVSRDRFWRLFEIQESGGFIPIAADKSHGRIIWDCAWAAEGDVFATASRDKTVKIWQRQQGKKWESVETIKLSAPGTAVAFAPGSPSHRQVFSKPNWPSQAYMLSGGDWPLVWKAGKFSFIRRRNRLVHHGATT